MCLENTIGRSRRVLILSIELLYYRHAARCGGFRLEITESRRISPTFLTERSLLLEIFGILWLQKKGGAC